MDARSLNQMLESRVKDLASKAPQGTPVDRLRTLAKGLGLDPAPPRTELNASVTGVIARNGYRIEKIRYESRPGALVTAHLYLPDGDGPWPAILRPYGHWELDKRSIVVQASAISLALAGYACLIIDPPGISTGERSLYGSHDDYFLAMGSPVQGVYTWDLIRGIDYLVTRNDIDLEKIGATGGGEGGNAAAYAFALDDRIKAVAPVAWGASLESNPHLSCLCQAIPGILNVGDVSDVFALRTESGAVMLLGAEDDADCSIEGLSRTTDKLRRHWRKREADVRFEQFLGGRDYNRRMREAVLAFFNEHLRGFVTASYAPEFRPITDGFQNPSPAETVDPASIDLQVNPEDNQPTRSFRDLLSQALIEPYPEPYRNDERVAPWRKYASFDPIRPGAIFAFHDESVESPKEPGSLLIPTVDIDQKLCTLLGLSVAEVLAQVLHFALPGGPETWESAGTGIAGDALTSMIASVRTLVSTPEAPPKLLIAEGPVASMVARFLLRYRPALEGQTSHLWTSWREALDQNIRENAQPGARYLEWI